MVTEFLEGSLILIVEDDYLTACILSEWVEDFGGSVVGPARGLAQATSLIEPAELAGAILDVNLGDEKCFALVDKLLADRIPVIFVTGADRRSLPDRFAEICVVGKPFDALAVEKALRRAFGVRRLCPFSGLDRAL